MSDTSIEKRADRIMFSGHILFLTENNSLIRRQVEAARDETRALEDKLAGSQMMICH